MLALLGIASFMLPVISFVDFYIPFNAFQTVRIDRKIINSIVGRGGFIAVRVVVRNGSRCRLENVRVRDSFPSSYFSLSHGSSDFKVNLNPFGSAKSIYVLKSKSDGAFVIGPLTLSIFDRLGFFEVSRVSHDLSKVVVIPPVEEVKASVSGGAVKSTLISIGEHTTDRRVIRMGWEYYSSREYVPGDDLTYIDWKATARTDKLHIKEFESRALSKFFLLIDCGRSMAEGMKLEYVKRAVMLFARSISIMGDFYGVLIPSISGVSFPLLYPRYVPLGTGLDHLYWVITVSTQLRPSGTPNFYEALQFIRRRLNPPLHLIFITDLEDFEKKNILKAAREALSLGYSVTCIVTPTYLFVRPGKVFSGVDVQSVALGVDYLKMLEERTKECLRELKGVGADVYEVGPSDVFPRFIEVYRCLRAAMGGRHG